MVGLHIAVITMYNFKVAAGAYVWVYKAGNHYVGFSNISSHLFWVFLLWDIHYAHKLRLNCLPKHCNLFIYDLVKAGFIRMLREKHNPPQLFDFEFQVYDP